MDEAIDKQKLTEFAHIAWDVFQKQQQRREPYRQDVIEAFIDGFLSAFMFIAYAAKKQGKEDPTLPMLEAWVYLTEAGYPPERAFTFIEAASRAGVDPVRNARKLIEFGEDYSWRGVVTYSYPEPSPRGPWANFNLTIYEEGTEASLYFEDIFPPMPVPRIGESIYAPPGWWVVKRVLWSPPHPRAIQPTMSVILWVTWAVDENRHRKPPYHFDFGYDSVPEGWEPSESPESWTTDNDPEHHREWLEQKAMYERETRSV